MRTLLECVLVSAAMSFSAVYAFDEMPFKDFLPQFRAALRDGNDAAVADLTRLPFLYDGRRLERDQFIDILATLFDREIRKCVEDAPALVEDDARVIFCGPYLFYFRRDMQAAWRFDEFGVDPEALQ